MGRIAKELGPLAVSKLKKPGLYFVGAPAGLALQVTPNSGKSKGPYGSRSWVLRVMIGGKRRDMGLGAYPGVKLARARDKAQDARDRIDAGIDPIEESRAARSALKAEAARQLTFAQAAAKYIATNKVGWRNAKHQAQWTSTLETYAYPEIGSLLVKDITVAHVVKILEPIWLQRTETATRVRQRVERVLDWAIASKYREGPNPAVWKGNLQMILPAPGKVTKVEHHTAVPVSEVGAFVVQLRKMEGTAARALEFAILTAARSGEVRGATWAEIDRSAKVWTIPAARMKAQREHRVPLSSEAIAILDALPRVDGSEFVFAAPRGGAYSDMALLAVVRRMQVDAVPHGFRSSFRDWCSERTNYPRDVAEMALAHTIADKTEAAYRRGDLFNKRVKLMAEWGAFVSRVEAKKGAVIPMRGKRA